MGDIAPDWWKERLKNKKIPSRPQHQKVHKTNFSNKKNVNKSNDVVIDSGGQEHTNWDRKKFSSYTPKHNETVTGINGKPYKIKGVGTIDIPAIIDDTALPAHECTSCT